MAAGDRIEVPCSACGPVPLDPALVELHLDPRHSFAFAVFLCVRCGRLGTSGQPGVELKVGDTAPDFALVGSDGKTWKLSELRGKTVVLAWFPKAFTGG